MTEISKKFEIKYDTAKYTICYMSLLKYESLMQMKFIKT